jgi:hypothetical protein
MIKIFGTSHIADTTGHTDFNIHTLCGLTSWTEKIVSPELADCTTCRAVWVLKQPRIMS